MPKKAKLSSTEFWINKTILGILLVLFALFAVIGYATHMLIGSVFMLLFMAIFGMLFEIENIKKWIDENINNKQW